MSGLPWAGAEPGYEYPQRIATPDALRKELIRVRASQRTAERRGDSREVARLGRRVGRLHAIARWRAWPTTGSSDADDY